MPDIHPEISRRSFLAAGAVAATAVGANQAVETHAAETASSPIVEPPNNEAPPVPDGLILGRELARTLGVKRGDVITAFSANTRLTPLGTVPRTLRFRVVGLFSSGLYEYDSHWAYISLAAAERIRGGGDTAGVIQMKVKDLYAVKEIAARVRQVAGSGFVTQTWQELNRPLFAAFQLQQSVIVVFFALLIAVAALNIITTLTMMVVEKQGDIAILRAQGATPQSIMLIFMLQGLVIGAVGATLGLALGFVTSWLANRYHLVSIPAEIYSISYVTVKVRATESAPPLAVPPSSRTVTVIVAVPLALATGVNERLPVAFGLA